MDYSDEVRRFAHTDREFQGTEYALFEALADYFKSKVSDGWGWSDIAESGYSILCSDLGWEPLEFSMPDSIISAVALASYEAGKVAERRKREDTK